MKISIDPESLNYLQIDSIRKLIRLAKNAHLIDIVMRIDGRNETIEGDFLKFLNLKEQ